MTSLRANPLKTSAEELCTKLLASGAKEARPGIVPGSVLARFEGSPAENELFRQGYFHVEGQASQLAALCVEAKPGETVIDLCAAPSGKTVLLAEQMQNTGRLYSCDAAENRVGLIRTTVQRMGLTNVEVLCSDATKGNPALPQADRILADVPCSGLGILAKSRICAIKSWIRPAKLNYWPRSRPSSIRRHSCSNRAAGWCTPPAPSTRQRTSSRSRHFWSVTRSLRW